MDKHKSAVDTLKSLGRTVSEYKKAEEEAKESQQSLELQPAMPELGTAPCPVCGHHVAVFVTRTKRPFINCGFCSARIFYNGSRSMQLLKDQIKALKKTEPEQMKHKSATTAKFSSSPERRQSQ
jgi:hypothetical protein